MTQKQQKIAAAIMGAIFISYAGAAFITLETNITNWVLNVRIGVVATILIILFFYFLIDS